MKALLTPTEAADYVAMKVETLAVWRCTGRHGLPYIKVGAAIRYRRSDLDAWLESRTVGKLETVEV
jgi:excisionase family DNA binding protein